jgi:lipoyl(octanoyl) transferase
MLAVNYINLGVKDFESTWAYQEQLLKANVDIKIAQRTAELGALPYTGEDTTSYFIFVEHPHVFTLGKSGQESNLKASPQELAAKQATYIKTNRGGDITYHGPGQIVGYPILDLEKIKPDIVWYMRSLEEVIIKTIAHFGIKGQRLPGATGVWIDADKPALVRKICAMGVRTSRWVTMHGFALNVNTNLNYFDMIIPCGIDDKGVTSMQKELGQELDYNAVQAAIVLEMEKEFGLEIKEKV